MRILARDGALRVEADSASRVFVRLIATPDRIKRELDAEDDVGARELLRALWRAVGKSLNDGASIDLEGLPPGFGGASGTLPVLSELQARQFLVFERVGGGLRLTNPKAPLSAFPIDWEQIERRRRVEMGKLETMQKYAYAPGCRRAFVLKYFGDPAARPKCEGCDNCLGIKYELSPAPAEERGRSPAARRRAGRAKAAAAPAQDTADLVLGPADQELFTSLKKLRASIAREEQVPAYVVFPDRTLVELAVRRPRTLAALSSIRGVGPTKLDKYGERFLAAIGSVNEPEAA
jgi:ATP-dependent DNA helicase RecQ